MPNMMIRHPSWTNVVKEDGGISLEWSAYFTMADKIITPMLNIPQEDLTGLPNTIGSINSSISNGGYGSFAEMLEALDARISLLEGYVSEILLMFGTNRICTVATAPDPVSDDAHPHILNYGGTIFVTNEAGGGTLAFSDGTNWRRVQDRAIIST